MRPFPFGAIVVAAGLTLGTIRCRADAIAISQSGNGNVIGNQPAAQTTPFSENLAIAIVAAAGAVAAASVPFILSKKRRRKRTANPKAGIRPKGEVS